MHAINVWLTVKDPSNSGKVAELMTEAVRLSRQEPGCERYDCYHSQADATKFLLVEHWTQKSDWETHRTAPAYTTIYQPQVIPLVEREAHVATPLE